MALSGHNVLESKPTSMPDNFHPVGKYLGSASAYFPQTRVLGKPGSIVQFLSSPVIKILLVGTETAKPLVLVTVDVSSDKWNSRPIS
jgi:hypothetical protein